MIDCCGNEYVEAVSKYILSTIWVSVRASKINDIHAYLGYLEQFS